MHGPPVRYPLTLLCMALLPAPPQIIHAIALNSSPLLRNQMAGSRWMPRLEKQMQKPQSQVIGAALAQLLLDWAYVFG